MLILLIMLLFAKVFGEVFERFGIPAMTGEVLAGLILGPSVMGFISDSHEMKAITDLGVLMLIVVAGMEIELREIKNSITGRNIWISLLGFIIPMGGGIAVGIGFGYHILFSIFLGLCLAITALPVSIRILMDLGKLHSDVGQRIISAAVFNDIVALLILGVLLDFDRQGGMNKAFYVAMLRNLLKVVVFMGILVSVYHLFKIARGRIGVFMPRMYSFLKFLKGQESLFAIYMIFVLAFAGLAELLGLHFIIGAFFGSILLPRELFPENDYEKVKQTTGSITMGFLAPLFFAYLGVLVKISSISNLLLFIVILITVTIGKTAGGYLGGRFAGLNRKKSMTLGIGLNTKGIMELVIASIAYQKGFIDVMLFTILVLIAILTTIATPLLLKRSFLWSDPVPEPSG